MKRTLLIVDDARLARMMIRSYAERADGTLRVIEAANGDDALRMVETADELTFCTIDHNMPGIRGIELAERIRLKFPRARLALVTANVQEALKKRAEQAGIEFIGKPVTEDRVSAFIASAKHA